MNAYETPLVELLKTVPKDARFVEEEEFSSTYHPVGRLCHEAADRIAELEKDLALKTRDRDVFRDFTLAYEKRIEELEKLEQDFIRVIKQTNPNKPQTKPLSDEEIWSFADMVLENSDVVGFARAIEDKHGIK